MDVVVVGEQRATKNEDKACPGSSRGLSCGLRWIEVEATWDDGEVEIVFHSTPVEVFEEDDMGSQKMGIVSVVESRPGCVLRQRMVL